jgi:hypothetical protein
MKSNGKVTSFNKTVNKTTPPTTLVKLTSHKMILIQISPAPLGVKLIISIKLLLLII